MQPLLTPVGCLRVKQTGLRGADATVKPVYWLRACTLDCTAAVAPWLATALPAALRAHRPCWRNGGGVFWGGRGSRGPRWRVSKGGARRARQARATWLLPVRPQVRGAASCERLRPRIYMRLRTVWNDIRPLPDHAGSSQGPLRIPKLQHLGTQASLLVVVLKLCLRIGAFGRGSTCTYGNLWRPPAHAHDGW